MVQVKLDKVKEVRVAYVELSGPYENWGRGLMKLKAWLEKNKVKIAGRPIGLFYDNPRVTPPERLRSEACLPVSETVRPEGKFKFKVLPPAEIAITKHEGPPEKYTETYGPFLEWILLKGYRFEGPAREVFPKASAELGPGMGVVIQQPIKRA